MLDWSNLEFSKPNTIRRPKIILPLLSELLMLWDATAGTVSAILAHKIVESQLHRNGSVRLPQEWLLIVLPASIAVACFLRKSRVPEGSQAFQTRYLMPALHRTFALFVGLYCFAYLSYRSNHLLSLSAIAWSPLFLFSVLLSRIILRFWLLHLQRLGMLNKSVAIIGDCSLRRKLAAQLSDNATIVGSFDLQHTERLAPADFQELVQLGRGGVVDQIVIASESTDREEIPPLLEKLQALPVEVVLCERESADSAFLGIQILGDMQLRIVLNKPISRRGILIKTFVDKIGAVWLLLCLSPLLILIALGIKCTSEGPVIFCQPRRGWCGQEFIVYKFRTMHQPPQGTRWFEQTARDDVRCTWIGNVLRRASLDELPQLWNVLIGEMSLVGPRPHAEYLHSVELAGQKLIAEYAQRNRVKPGLTGLAQVNGARGAATTLDQISRRIKYDLHYIEHWSLALDLKILALTPFCLVGENVY